MPRYAPFLMVACVLTLLAPVASRAASVVPSIEITGIASGSADTRAGSGARVNVLLNNPGTESDNYEIYNGSLLLYRWTGETYGGVGPNGYGLPGVFAALPADTTLTAIIYTFPRATIPPAPYTSAEDSYASAASWNCTTGALVSIVNNVGGVSVAQVPAVQPARLALMAFCLAALGALALARTNAATRNES